MAFVERFVTDAAAGGGDGTEGNPWTLAEALTNQVAGDRVNVQSDGPYSLAADAFTNAGTIFDIILMRGYNTTIGDLEGQGRNADGTLDITNFPLITLTGLLNPSAFCFVQNLAFTGALNAALIGNNNTDSFGIISCELINTNSSANARCVQLDNSCTLINSDFECTGATHNVIVDTDIETFVHGCRFKGVANDAITSIRGSFIGNTFIGNGTDVAIDFQSRSAPPLEVVSNTFYNWATVLQFVNVAPAALVHIINNHATDCGEWLNNLYSATDFTPVIEMNNRTRDNTTPRTGIGDGFNIAEVTTDTGGDETDYTNAGADDFSLISAAPGREAALGAGSPDIGGWQGAAGAGGAGGLLVHPGMSGGMRG